jgi:hypothetical protein
MEAEVEAAAAAVSWRERYVRELLCFKYIMMHVYYVMFFSDSCFY